MHKDLDSCLSGKEMGLSLSRQHLWKLRRIVPVRRQVSVRSNIQNSNYMYQKVIYSYFVLLTVMILPWVFKLKFWTIIFYVNHIVNERLHSSRLRNPRCRNAIDTWSRSIRAEIVWFFSEGVLHRQWPVRTHIAIFIHETTSLHNSQHLIYWSR